MKEIYFLLLISIVLILIGLKDLYNKKIENKFYNGVKSLIYGIGGLLFSISYIILGEHILVVYLLILTFLFGGGYGIFYNYKIKDGVLLSYDIAFFLFGITAIIYYIFYLFGVDFLKYLPDISK